MVHCVSQVRGKVGEVPRDGVDDDGTIRKLLYVADVLCVEVIEVWLFGASVHNGWPGFFLTTISNAARCGPIAKNVAV